MTLHIKESVTYELIPTRLVNMLIQNLLFSCRFMLSEQIVQKIIKRNT